MKPLPLILVFALVLLSACTTKVTPQPISKKPLLRISTLSGDGVFSADQDGRKVAIADDGLSIYNIGAKSIQQISNDEPFALAWSHDGLTLAAAFPVADYETRLALYSPAGEIIRVVTIPAALTHMTWTSRDELLVAGLVLKVYKFGGNLRQSLYRIDTEEVRETLLTDSTLRPSLVAQVTPLIKTLQPVAFSPFGDELAYLDLHDPPEFAPYFELKYRNCQASEARSMQRLTLQLWQLQWGPEDDTVELSSAQGPHTFKLWGPLADDSGHASAARYRFNNGRLYDGEALLADWGEDARWQMLTGGRFLLAVQHSIYLGDGLREMTERIDSEKRWNLRRWRYQGLITQGEYQELLLEEEK